MAWGGEYKTLTIQAKEDLNTHQFQAVALDDGKVANDGSEAAGILINKPKTNEHATIAYQGISKFRAGAAISKGAGLTIATSGYLATAVAAKISVTSLGADVTVVDSGSRVVGTALAAVTSGSIGSGMFDFTKPATYLS